MTDRQKLTRRVHAEAHRLGFTEEGRIALQVRVTGRRSLATMSAQQLEAVLAALADPEALAADGPREPVSSQKAEIYLQRAFARAGRSDLAPSYDEIELWAHTPWRRNHGKAVAREALPVAVRGDRKSAPRWDPDELDRYVRRALDRAGAAAFHRINTLADEIGISLEAFRQICLEQGGHTALVAMNDGDLDKVESHLRFCRSVREAYA